jgi:hypothetical protein
LPANGERLSLLRRAHRDHLLWSINNAKVATEVDETLSRVEAQDCAGAPGKGVNR